MWRFKRRALRHWTQISPFFLILKIDCTDSKKAVKFGNFQEKTHFFSHVNRTFSDISQNWFDIWVHFSNTRLLIRHTTIHFLAAGGQTPLLAEYPAKFFFFNKVFEPCIFLERYAPYNPLCTHNTYVIHSNNSNDVGHSTKYTCTELLTKYKIF